VMTAVPLRRVFLPDGDAGVTVGEDTAAVCARMATDVLTLCRCCVHISVTGIIS